MASNTPLRDPFATEDDEPPRSGAGRPPPRTSRFGAPGPTPSLRATPPTQPSSRPHGSLGAPRSLGLSLGVPRSRMVRTNAVEHSEADGGRRTVQTDDAVRATDSDALLSRLSALRLGYLSPEPYTQEFAAASASSARGMQDSAARRSPLINIGTFLRCSTIDQHVETFLMAGTGRKQIISIGAGSDSRYWRIMSDARLAGQLQQYIEVDFAENVQHKLACIRKSSVLQSLLDAPPSDARQRDEQGRCVLRSSKYSLLAADVRLLHPDTPEADRIEADSVFGGLDASLPTLVLFECVLAYIEPSRADWLLAHLGERFARIEAVSYDIALASDSDASSASRFGEVMLGNLERRGLEMAGAKAYATISAQSRRFVSAWIGDGCKTPQVEATSLYAIWTALPASQKQRLSRLEGLDELEEFDLLLRHYCIVRAYRE
ncbi:leucine carboxyl methyltransferase [Moesziomyces antarcticus]|uniref:Related to PPM1 \|nr:leucine carboxyl methyltransferase [Moesziomyces antarcticus]GAK67679.1 leucine carboxyl methyltransferase [Moesziomyces antarcticus]SPO49089.1 related to PPM1 \